MRNKLLVVLLLLLVSCASKPFTSEDALTIARQFVEGRVRFFAGAENATSDIPEAKISIVNIYPESNGMWTVLLYIEGVADNTTKRGGLAILVDPKTRAVRDAKPFNPRMNESNVTPRMIASENPSGLANQTVI